MSWSTGVTVEPDEAFDRAVHDMVAAHVSALAVVDRLRRLVEVLTTTGGLLARLQQASTGQEAG